MNVERKLYLSSNRILYRVNMQVVQTVFLVIKTEASYCVKPGEKSLNLIKY